MKRLMIIFLILSLTSILFGNNIYELTGSSSHAVLNILKVNYFDPSQPYSQPLLFNLTIKIPEKLTEDDSDRADYNLMINLYWNGNLLTSTNLEPVDVISPSNQYASQFTVSNRDVITSEDNRYFEADGNFSFDDVMENNSQFEDFLLETGRFPDGDYRIDIQLEPENSLYQGNSTSINFTVRGIQSVRLLNPGLSSGVTNIPQVFKPLVFNWTSSGFNNSYKVEIKEFDHASELDPSNIEFNGRLVEEEWVNNMSVYSPNYNFQEEKYYAWRVKVRYIGEEALNQEGHNQFMASSYNVFQFASSPVINVANAFQEELEKNLRKLNIAEIISLFDAGYLPKDGIILNGKTYYGKEAVDKIRELFNEYEIEVSID